MIENTCSTHSPIDRRLPMKIVNAVREWLRRSNERHPLAGLSERQLRDVGLDREPVQYEITITQWRA